MKKNGFGTGVMYVMLILLLVGLALLIVFNYRANVKQNRAIEEAEAALSVTPTPEPTATPAPTAEPDRNTQSVTLAFAGDIIGQSGLANEAQRTADGVTTYDFTDELSGVRAAVEGADLAACTLVSTLTSSGTYEAYQMPRDVADGLKGVGFDLVNAATDHLLDRGLTGLVETVDTLRNTGLGVLGAYSTEGSRSLPMAEKNGMKIAFLSYTYGTAGTGAQPVSVAENPWCIDLLTTDYMTEKETVDYEKIDADIAAVKDAGADIVVCFVYWWDSAQYYTEPRQSQTELAQYLFENGVDVLIGGGVKVPQPIQVQVVERSDGTKANCVACYSLSNLMSCFNDNYTNISAVVDIQLSRDTESNEVWISSVAAKPLFMVDTSDYEGYTGPMFRYRVLDAREAIGMYEQSQGGPLSSGAYEAARQGVEDLMGLLGNEYDAANGGTALQFPY